MIYAQAGTLESNDIMLTVAPGAPGSGIIIDLQSIVLAQYGSQIKSVILETVAQKDINDIYLKAVDRGALDCTIRARTLAVLERAAGKRGEA